MRYASIRSMDISNGSGIGVAAFVQGCHMHCTGCFNQETWDFNGGKEWTEEVENKFLEIANKSYITRVSILGGEPLAVENCKDVYNLCKRIKQEFPNKKIWVYTGYTYENLSDEQLKSVYISDVLVDGSYVESQKDMTLHYKGSKNQRVINIPETLKQNKVVLYCD